MGENTPPKSKRLHDKLKPAWEPGQSGNPAGRPKGSRNKLEEAFLRDLHTAWGEFGIEAIKTVAKDDPASFLRVIAGLMPKQAQVSGEGGGPLKLQLISGDSAL
jgi:hypothetical protein